jgi:hypothetical protein
MSDETQQANREQERDETMVKHLTNVHDFCRRLDTDASGVMGNVEEVINASQGLRKVAKDMNQRQRRVVADALGAEIREVMS